MMLDQLSREKIDLIRLFEHLTAMLCSTLYPNGWVAVYQCSVRNHQWKVAVLLDGNYQNSTKMDLCIYLILPKYLNA